MASIIQDQLDAKFIGAIILIQIFVFRIGLTHVILIKLKLMNYMYTLNRKTIQITIENNFKGVIIFCLLAILISYLQSFQSYSPLAQIPFYLSLFFTIQTISTKKFFESKLTNLLPIPIWQTNLFLFSVVLFIYLNLAGIDSFHFLSNIFHSNSLLLPFEYVFGRLSTNYDPNTINFAPIGFLASSFALIIIPFNCLFQSKSINQDNDENKLEKNEEDFESIKDSLSCFTIFNQEIERFNLNNKRALLVIIYIIFLVAIIYLGLNKKIIVIVICATGFLYFIVLNIWIKDQRFLWKLFQFFIGFFGLNVISFIGQIDDQFAFSILSDLKDGWCIYIVDACVRNLMLFFSISLCKVLIESEQNKSEEEENSDDKNDQDLSQNYYLFSTLKFILYYLFSIYLLQISEIEKSFLISSGYTITAVIIFYKLLMYSSHTEDEISRIITGLFLYLAGSRLLLVSGSANLPLYFASILSNFGIFGIYFSNSTKMSKIVTLLMFAGSLFQATFMKSLVLLQITLLNIQLFISVNLCNTLKKKFICFAILTILHVVFVLANGISLSLYFDLVNVFIKLLPSRFMDYYGTSMLGQGDLFEQIVIKTIFKQFSKMFLPE